MSLPAASSVPPLAAIYESDAPSQDPDVSDVPVDANNDNTSDKDEVNWSGDKRNNGEEMEEDAVFHRAA